MDTPANDPGAEIPGSKTQQQVYFPMAELDTMANAFVESKLFGCKEKSQALSLLLIAQAEGMHPAVAIQEFDIVNGKPARKTHAVLARYQDSGGKIEWHQLTDQCADATFHHPKSIAPVRIEWTIQRANAVLVESYDNRPGAERGAKIKTPLTDKEVWKNYPRAMLRARVIAEGVRATFPRAIGGMLVVEEAQDLTDTIEGTATRADTAIHMPKQIAANAGGGDPPPDVIKTAQGELVHTGTGEVKKPEEQQQAGQTAQTGELGTGNGGAKVNEGMLKVLRGKIKAAQGVLGPKAMTEEQVAAHFKIAKLEDLTAGTINDALEVVKRQVA